MKYLIGSGGHHITQKGLRDFAAGSLGPEELDAVAQHIAECEQCALALAEAIETKQPSEAPAGFEEEILDRISRSTGTRAELFRFSFRVALAACVAFLFIFSSALNTLAGCRNPLAEIKAPGFSVVENINTHLRDFSQQILEMEAFQNAQETK